VVIHVHPEATGAVLEEGGTLWFLVFNGPNGVRWDLQLMTPSELGSAIGYGYSDADVVSYVEKQLEAAGYKVHRRPRGNDKAAWTLAFIG
jgi:hypothetical protein